MFLPSYITTKPWQLFISIAICLESGIAKLITRKPNTKNKQTKHTNKKTQQSTKIKFIFKYFFLGLPIGLPIFLGLPHVRKMSPENDVKFKLVLGRFNNGLEVTILHSSSSFGQRCETNQTGSFSCGPLLGNSN